MTNTENKTQIPSIKQLRQSGRYKVKIHHERILQKFVNDEGKMKIKQEMVPLHVSKELCKKDPMHNLIMAKGGRTTIYLHDIKLNKHYEATSQCHTNDDNFCYNDAYNYCFERIVEQGAELTV